MATEPLCSAFPLSPFGGRISDTPMSKPADDNESGSANPITEPPTPRETLIRDSMASLVVFLVALPLCIGIAVACGVPAERGLVTGIIGGLIGFISGAPLLVSGPAASLIVPCAALVADYGLIALGPVVALAGSFQILAGYLRLGQWFRAVAPAVITGMLTGIGVLIIGSQLLVAVDRDPEASFIGNILAVPVALYDIATGAEGARPHAFFISVATIVLLVGWTKWRPKMLSIIPGHLVALLTVTTVSTVFALDALALNISSNFFAGLGPPSPSDFRMLLDPDLIGRAGVFAFVASAATLLTANAIDEVQNIVKTDYDQEMKAQGVGNFLAGLVGGLPMTGVIVRSSANVDAGARTRRSTIFHAVWIMIFVLLAPQALELIPRASLGAILVYIGVKLVDLSAMNRLWQQGRAEFAIFVVTLAGVVFVDLFSGILGGLAAAVLKIVWTFAHLEIKKEEGPSPGVVHLHLVGAATFVQLPRLARELDAVPVDKELHVHIDRLDHIDHACMQLLTSAQRQREAGGDPPVYVAWEELADRYRTPAVGTGPSGVSSPSPSIVQMVWAEWRRAHADVLDSVVDDDDSRWNDWIPAEDILVKQKADCLADVLAVAAPRLAKLTGLPAAQIVESLTEAGDEHVPIGDGVGLPHAGINDLDQSHVVVVTTETPLQLTTGTADVFFVLLSPQEDAREHLRALAHIARMCHHSPDMLKLRGTDSPSEAAALIDGLSQAAARGRTFSGAERSLALVDLEDAAHAVEMRRTLSEAFTRLTLITEKDHDLLALLRPLAGNPEAGAILVTRIEGHEEPMLRALVREANKLSDARAQLAIFREQT